MISTLLTLALSAQTVTATTAAGPTDVHAHPAFRTFNPSASADCGSDRRCRLRRMRYRNQRWRRSERQAAEQKLALHLKEEEKNFRNREPRVAKPFAVALTGARIGVGIEGSWTILNGHVQPFIGLHGGPDANLSEETSVGFVDGRVDMLFGKLGARGFLFNGPVTPFISLAMLLGYGNFENYGFNNFDVPVPEQGFFDEPTFFDESSFNNEARADLVEVGMGVDMQLGFGLKSNLGVYYRKPLYAQVRESPGVYDEIAREALQGWLGSRIALDVIFSMGWAF